MKKGFTLIELILVLIILGILVALMIPQISGMMERARTGEAKRVLGSMRTSLMAFYMERTPNQFPTAAANIAAIEGIIGDVVDDAKSLFLYSWPDASAATDITVTAVRDTTKSFPPGAMTSTVKMKIYGTGAADVPTVSWAP